MIINKLAIIGKNLPNAEIDFSPACTIISGASDTGKTFIFECLEFMFGREEGPKTFPIVDKYEVISLTFTASDQKQYEIQSSVEL